MKNKKKKIEEESTSNIKFDSGVLIYDSLTLRQKIAQMIIVRPRSEYLTNLNIGAVHVGGFVKKNEKNYHVDLINNYQNKSKIKILFVADLEGGEGLWNPFVKFYNPKPFSEVKDKNDSYNLGKEHGQVLKELGIGMNFSPIVEPLDNVWKERVFIGTDKEIKEKIIFYIKGLQSEKILSTAKHYPGKYIDVKNPHFKIVKSQIGQKDLEFFDVAIKANVSAIMIGHQIVSGTVDSGGKPSTVSKEVIDYLKNKQNFSSLIISDDINMWNLKYKYLFRKNQLYLDLILAGNDMIIDSFDIPTHTYKRINFIEGAIKEGKISEERINESVKKILKHKGIKFK